ncbi:MAG: hypothetical protein Q9163_000689 [Psora crenata]
MPVARRAFTAPVKTIRQNISSLETEAQGAETLFAHGPLRIYRVLGSVAFLNSGNILQPILAKSQCWCVDGVSKFVLRIRPNTYYRMELPYKTLQDKETVELFKDVLSSVLQYEKTPCPFKRGFTVDLPEAPNTPTQKKPWRPKRREEPAETTIAQLPGDFGDLNVVDEEQVNKEHWLEAKGTEMPDDATTGLKVADFPADASDAGSSVSTNNGNTDDTGSPQRGLYKKAYEEALYFRTPPQPRRIITGRTVTAPPYLPIRTSATSRRSGPVANMPTLNQVSSSFSSSVESFHSFHSFNSPPPRSPPSPSSLDHDTTSHETATLHASGHRRDESATTVTAGQPELWNLHGAEVEPPWEKLVTPALVSDAALNKDEWENIKPPSPPALRIRQSITKLRRCESPLPPCSNLYPPYSPRRDVSGHHLTTIILQRTCSFLLGPPAQLIALMLQIAAKIVKGAFNGESFGRGEQGQRIPCSWDFSDGSDGESWDEDDYGVALGKTISGKKRTGHDVDESWQID